MEQYIQQIEENGYCKIPQVLNSEQVLKTLNLVKSWYEQTKESIAENLPALAKNDPFVWNLQNKDYYFLELLFYSETVHKILMYFLNDKWFKQFSQDEPNYILRSLMGKSTSQVLPMHIDSLVPYTSPEVFVMQISIVLEDQNETNGCTMVVPGSHKSNGYANQSAFDSAVPLEAKAGDVLIWDSRLWHGTGENNTDGTRWVMIATFTRWWIKQMFNIHESIPQDIYERLTNSQKAVLGFCSLPYKDETKGIDMKRGYDSLLPDVLGYR